MLRDHPVNPTAQQSPGKLEGKTPLVVFLVLALAIGAVGYVVFAHLNEAIRQDKYHELSTVGDLKVSQIVGWLDERRGDAAATTRDPILAQVVQRWLQRGAPHDEAGRRIESRLQGLREAYGYDKVILLDRGIRPALVAGDALHQHAHAESNQRAAEAMSAGQPLLSDLHLEAKTDGAPAQVNIDLYAPLFEAGGVVVGVVYFQIDPYRFLYPFIQSWPTPSRSKETLLVRRDGDDVLYLNELRHRKDSALRFRLPLNTPDLPAAKSLRGETGVIEGVDYRGIPVLAALRTIPGTSWHLVAKIDQAEVFAPVQNLAIGVSIVVAILVAGAGLLVALWWRKQQTQFLVMHFKDELERQALVQHFDYLSRFANDIIFLVDEDSRIVEANEAAVVAYGYSRERLLTMRSRDLRASEALPSFEDDRQKVAALGSRKYETVHQRSDGSTFPVDANVRVIAVEGKQYRQAIIRDVGERKHVENALHESEAKFRGISHAAQDAIILLDPAGSVQYWNPAAARVFGYAESEILGKNMHRLLAPQRYHEEAQRGFAQFSKTGTGRYVGRTVELTGLRKDGTEFPVEVSFSGFERAGAWHAVGIARDITERKRTEEALRDSEWRFRQLAENIGEAFWFLSFKPEQLVFVNPAFTKIWGIAEHDVRYHPRILTESVHPDDREKFVRAFEFWRARHSTQGYELQYRIVRPDGNVRWVCNHVAGVMDDHGGLWGACGVVEDITERLRAEQALRDHAEQLRQLSRRLFEVQETARRELARELHDRIGQNVTALTLNLNMIRAELPADCPGTVGTRLDDSETLLYSTGQLIRDIMVDLRPPGLEELGLLAALTEHARQVAGRSRLSVTVTGTEITPRLPPATEIMLFRIAQEALMNVAKHARASEVTVALESGPATVLMTVADNGLGFDTTARLVQPTSSLGMVTMRERAEAIGGRLRVESAPSQGTRVIVEVSRAAPAAASQPHLPGMEPA